MKDMQLFCANYYTEEGNRYNGENLETLVFVGAPNHEDAEIKADEIMIEKEMNLDDLWILGGIHIVKDKSLFLKSFVKDFSITNIFE